MPSQDEYQQVLKKSWNKNWITNRGELVIELEQKIKRKYDLKEIILTTNGTLPLQIAIKALKIKGEIITTPFSYVATTSSIVWEGCTPVFVDIEPDYFTIDPTKIEKKITNKTTAIIATHVFGNPCNVELIEIIAKKHKLKVIYDAAHCFGISYKGRSLFNYGDISTCSFHATKIFHTGEGGALFTKNKEIFNKLYYHHNFGHNGPNKFHGLGINAKMSELQAAMGLTLWSYFDDLLIKRKLSYKLYLEKLEGNLIFQKIREGTIYNYSYFPVVFPNESQLLKVEKSLNKENIFPRRYFYPSLNKLPYVREVSVPISESLSSRILCLPLYFDLTREDIFMICDIINKNNN